jgi:hypothetical protein
MLRIVTEQHEGLYTIALHGKIAGEWVPVLDHFWQCLTKSVPSPRLTAVLTDVSFIDGDGERLLERMWRDGVRFVASGCMNRHVIERIEARSRAERRGSTVALGITPRDGS